MMNPVRTSHRLTRRPASVRGKRFRPQDRLLGMIDALQQRIEKDRELIKNFMK